MNPNPMQMLRRMFGAASRKFTNPGGEIALITRTTQQALGPWTGVIDGFLPHQVNPWLYEGLRESIPILDGALNRLVTMDGIVTVEGDNAKLVAEVQDWIDNVAVNDAEVGLQAFYSSQGNEVYEQGVAIGEYVIGDKGRDIVSLRVADSKGIYFSRDDTGLRVWYRPPGTRKGIKPDGSDMIESILRRNVQPAGISYLREVGYTELDNSTLVYVVNHPEADNPYGTSMLRSLEFIAQILLKIQNAMGRSWERFGDPPLHVAYNTKNRQISSNAIELSKRKDEIASNLAKTLLAKSSGNSVDFITAFGMDDTLSINVIGANGIALDATVPVAHLLQEIVAKFNLPPWMLGVPVSISEGLAEQQSIVVLQESMTRFARRKPGLTNLVATMLRLRGRTWKPGDWKLVQQLPNLQNELQHAQAAFLRAQTQMMLAGNATATPPARGVDNNLRHPRTRHTHKHKAPSSTEDDPAEPFAESDPELPRIEARGIADMLALWDGLRARVAAVLGLDAAKQAKASDPLTWRFDSGMLSQLSTLGNEFERSSGAVDGPLVKSQFDAWLRGVINAGVELSVADVIEESHARVREAYRLHGGELISSVMGREYRDRVMAVLASGVYDGMNPTVVALQMAKLFGDANYDWERLIRSEVAMAQVAGKEAQYIANGMGEDLFDFVTAGSGACPVCIGLAEAGPYRLTEVPMPVEDTHPNCRCSWAPHADA